MSDWFTDGYKQLIKDGAEHVNVSEEVFQGCYGFLVNIGLIDYDAEKEIIYGRYVEEDEE